MRALTFILLILLSGCGRQWCQIHYPPTIVTVDSVIERTRLDTSYIILPGDTTVLKVPIPCPDYDASVNSREKQIKVVIKDRIMTVFSFSKADSIRVIRAYEENNKSKVVTKVVEREIIKYRLPWWFYLVITGSVLVVIYKIFGFGWIKRFVT